MKKHLYLKYTLRLIIIVLIIGSGFWIINNYRYLLDIYAKKISTKDSVAAIYSKHLELTDSGDLMLFGTYPEIKEKEDFNLKCDPPQNVIELGCYKTVVNKIYVLNINEPNLKDIEVVTMAHELLHSAYERLSSKEKNKIKNLLEKELSLLKNDKELQSRLKNYENSQPGSKNNELHSIIATEYKNLSKELEDYYKKYFKNRIKIVNLNEKNKNYLLSKEQEIQEQKQYIENLQSELNLLEAKMDKLKALNNISQYNLLVPKQNSLVEKLRTEINEYNEKVTIYNDIINSINSRSYSSFDNI
ncbi:MAG: hypothetical protein QXG00_07670 [Candidatus Woesearchaeota archaeon]